MARSFDKRRHQSGPLAGPDNISTMRGPKRAVYGRLVPGDDIEVVREIERIWDWISNHKGRIDDNTKTIVNIDGGGGGSTEYRHNDDEVGSEPALDFKDGSKIIWNITDHSGDRVEVEPVLNFYVPGAGQLSEATLGCLSGGGGGDPMAPTLFEWPETTDNDNSIVLTTGVCGINGMILDGWVPVVTATMGGVPPEIYGLRIYVGGSGPHYIHMGPDGLGEFLSGDVVIGGASVGDDGCAPVEFVLMCDLFSILTENTIGGGNGAISWVYAPNGYGSSVNSYLPPPHSAPVVLQGENNIWVERDELDVVSRVKVSSDGSLVGTRREIDFIEGDGIDIAVSDHDGDERVEIVISASAVEGLPPPTTDGQILVSTPYGVGAEIGDGDLGDFIALQAAQAHNRWLLQEASGDLTDDIGGIDLTTHTGIQYQEAGPFDSDYSIGLNSNPASAGSPAMTVTNNLTMEMLISGPTPADQKSVFDVGFPGSDGYAILSRSSGKFQGLIGGVSFLSNSSGLIFDGDFHLVHMIRRAGTWEYWIDGVLDTPNAGTTTPNTPASVTRFNRESALDFNLAYPACYAVALTSTDIQQRMTALAGATGFSWVPLDPGSNGDVLTMVSGNPAWT